MNSSVFADDYAYGFQFYAAERGSPFVAYERLAPGTATMTSASNPFNTFGPRTAAEADHPPPVRHGPHTLPTQERAVAYTLSYSVLRLTDLNTQVSVAVTGGLLPAGLAGRPPTSADR